MTAIRDILFRKLCYLFHRGFVESRALAEQQKTEQAHDLADAFEMMPGFLPNWQDSSLELIRSNLRVYQNKYGPSTFDYLAVLDMDDARFAQVFSAW